MQPSIAPPDQTRLATDGILLLAAVLFAGAPAFGLCYWMVWRWRLRGTRVLLVSAAFGIGVSALLMLWLGNAGVTFAFCTLVGGFFGARLAGEGNRMHSRRRRGASERQQKTDRP